MPPLIGITPCRLLPDYVESVRRAGGEPCVLQINAEASLKELDGVLLTGGGDIAPAYYHAAPHPKTNPPDAARDAFELELARLALESDVPLFGVCLGAQLLAASLGARVYRGDRPEVGVLPVTLTEEGRNDPVFSALPAEVLSLQWHSDTFDLPDGAVRLAGSPAYPNQAFRVGSSAYAVQFHLEVSQAMACEWAAVPAYAQALESTEGKGAFDRLLASFEAASADLLGHARTLFERWFELVSPAAA